MGQVMRTIRPINTVCVALTGASGMPYGIRLIENLLSAGKRVWVLYSQAAQVVAKQEMDLTLPSSPKACAEMFQAKFGVTAEQLSVFGKEEWFAPVASGTNPADAMVVCPATMGTMAAIAQGLSDNLIERAADVSIKEGRPLIIVPRETPLSSIHLRNMLALAEAGVCILPPSPGFYHHPQTLDDVVDFVVARILDQLNIPHQLMKKWAE